jgi:DNA-binding winged helix-turn-helix (wHTH) protein
VEGDLRIDQWLVQPQVNSIVSPDNATIQLEPKVMEVLVYLADHADEVLPKERILQAVWPDTFVTEDVLVHAVVQLRKALGDDVKEPRYIQTIAKRGYRLVASVSKLQASAARYEIIIKLGQGAMGEVFLAKDTELHWKVALKFVLEQDAKDETSQKRLLREVRAAAALDHPYICKVFDIGEIAGKTFITMEYVEGRTLKQKLSQARVEIKEALRVAAEIAEALEAAHDKGIVHRDLKHDA